MFRFVHHLIGRLSVSRKLVLIYALDLTAVIFVSTILINEKYIAINFARKEIVGNAYISEVRDALLPSATGSALAKPPTQILVEAERRYGEGMGSLELADILAARLDAVGAKAVASDQQKHDLALAVQALLTRIGNQSNLILDPDLDSYYTMSLVVLRFPELFDLSLRIGDKAIEVGQAVTPAMRSQRQTEYLIIEGRIDAVASGIAADYDEALAAGGPWLKDALQASRDRLLAAVERMRSATRQAALGAPGDLSAASIGGLNRELETSLAVAWGDASAALDELLDRRIETLFSRMWWHLGTATALLLLILTLVFFVARMIALPIRRLSEVAENVSHSGDYALRAEWTTGDELGRLVNAFNQMLEKLDHSRQIEQELAASSRAAEAQRKLLEAIPMPSLIRCGRQREGAVPGRAKSGSGAKAARFSRSGLYSMPCATPGRRYPIMSWPFSISASARKSSSVSAIWPTMTRSPTCPIAHCAWIA